MKNKKGRLITSQLPAYPEMKDSGVEWLGAIPAEWRVKRLKYQASINDDALPENSDPEMDLMYVDISSVDAIIGITHTEYYQFSKAPSRARRLVHHGDVIVSTVRTYLRAITTIQHPPDNLVVSTGFAVIRSHDGINHKFFSYALTASYFVDGIVARSVGASYPAINASDIGCITIVIPALPEQKSIATYLDQETAKIDTLVEKKKELIKLLQEWRTALITQAVTRGLNPEAPMRDSGVEWLGEIPGGWKILRLKHAAAIRDDRGAVEHTGSLYIGLDQVESKMGRLIHAESAEAIGGATSSFRPNDVLFGKLRPYLAKVLIADSSGICSKEFIVFEPSDTVSAKCLFYQLLSDFFIRQVDSMTYGAKMPRVNPDQAAEMTMPFAPLQEQQAIAAYLDQETAKIDALIAKTEEAIALLQESRSALITAAVTGQIDVRGAVDPPAEAVAS